MLDTPYKVNAMFGTQLTEMDTLFTIDVLYQRNISAQKRLQKMSYATLSPYKRYCFGIFEFIFLFC